MRGMEAKAQGRSRSDDSHSLSLRPVYALVPLTLLLLTFMCDALRDALDPRKADT